jgi:hypothetical protein
MMSNDGKSGDQRGRENQPVLSLTLKLDLLTSRSNVLFARTCRVYG